MDIRTGETYRTLREALDAGVPRSDIARVSRDEENKLIIRFSKGSFKTFKRDTDGTLVLGMTYTYAVLDVPRAVYAAVRALLDRADYSHAFHTDKDGEVIDMHGIALRSIAGPAGTDITVSTLLSSRTKQGRIDFTLNGELTQMDLDKAREVVGMLQGAIEAAISDELLYRFLTEKIGMDTEHASMALLHFRELRQGSQQSVYPS